MATAFDPRPVRTFVLEEDRELPPEQQSEFQLGRLDVFGYSALNALVGNDPNQTEIKLAVLIEVARGALRGWSKFPMPDGSPAEFVRGPTGFANDETMRCLKSSQVGQLAMEVLRFENVSKLEAGKSTGGGS